MTYFRIGRCPRLASRKIRCEKLSVFKYCTIVSDNIFVPFASKYDSKVVESDKYEKWESAGYFRPKLEMNSKTYSMILPPPNVTGTLHLGHALTITVQDILCRWKRMQGYSVVWVPGTDHAGIATQVVVEKKLFNETGQTRNDIGRERFLQLVDEWKNEKMMKINEQMRQLGASVDWSRYYFTIDAEQSSAVVEAIIRLFEDGLLYREKSLVNWCFFLQSTISDYEIEQVKIDKPTRLSIPGYDEPVEFGKIFDFSYELTNSDEKIVVSSTRPETIFGDVAVAVHPSDDRYKHVHGASLRNPLTQSIIPIICDEAVNVNLGTGAVKITPAHSKIDFEIGKRHNLPNVTILTKTGQLNENCGEFAGLPRFIGRQKVLKKLFELGSLKEIKSHELLLPVCSRSGDVVEQFIEPQWFINCNELRDRAVRAVENGDFIIEPKKHVDTYFRWLNNEHDWCISRQVWWGHQLPLYLTDCGWVAAKSEIEAKAKAKMKLGYESKLIERDTNVLDTWFSSALLPFSAFCWPQTNKDLQKFYPLSLMETGADILNFWVVRMVFLGLYFTNEIPFKKVLLHGMICDSRGRKMSKSLGNVIDFDYLIHGITLKELREKTETNHKAGILSAAELQYALKFQKELFPKGIAPCGADPLRLTLASLEYKDHVINFSPNMCRDNKIFCNKIWQASKFIIGWSLNLEINVPVSPQPQNLWHQWILDRLAQTVEVVENGLDETDFHVVTRELKHFFHHDLCDVYLEVAKPVLKSEAFEEANTTCSIMLYCLEVFLRLMSPIMPFLSEELHSYLPVAERRIVWETTFPRSDEYCMWKNNDACNKMNLVIEIVTSARCLIQELHYKRKDAEIVVCCEDNLFLQQCALVMHSLIRCKSIVFCGTDYSSEIPGLVSTIKNKALVFLIKPKVTDREIIANMKLLHMQMMRQQKELNMRLENSSKAKQPNEEMKEILKKWCSFQSSADIFFKNSVQSSSRQRADLMTATKFVSEAHEFKKQILEALKPR